MDEFLQDIVDCFNKETSTYADTPEKVLEEIDKAVEKETRDTLNAMYKICYPDE